MPDFETIPEQDIYGPYTAGMTNAPESATFVVTLIGRFALEVTPYQVGTVLISAGLIDIERDGGVHVGLWGTRK